MNWQFTPYIIPLLLTVALGGVVAMSAWKRRNMPGTYPLFWMAIAAGAWALFHALEISSLDIQLKLIFSNIEYISIVSIPVLWVLFALDYSGLDHGRHSRFETLMLLSIVPTITLILVWTNQWHGLMRQAISLDMSGPFSTISKAYGPWFWIHTAYSYSLAAVGSMIVGHTIFHPSRIYRSQALILMIGTVIPWIANAAYLVYRGRAFSGIDITPTAFAVSALLLEIGIAKTGLFSIIGFARNYVLDEIDDIVIVTDTQDQIVDLNLAAQNLLDVSINNAIGQDVSQIFQSLEKPSGNGDDKLSHYLKLHPDSRISAPDEISFLVQGEQRFYDITISPLNTGGKTLQGKLITGKDVTRQIKTYQTLEQLQYELKEQAIRDPLTKLYNRRGLAKSLLDNLDTYKQENTYVSVIMADINEFKKINDHYGHHTGDQVLAQIAAILQKLCKPPGIAARYGGDEFVLIVPENQATGEQLAIDITNAVKQWNKDNSLIEMPISLAIGFARCYPDSDEPVEACLRKADSLMYQNKQNSKYRPKTMRAREKVRSAGKTAGAPQS